MDVLANHSSLTIVLTHLALMHSRQRLCDKIKTETRQRLRQNRASIGMKLHAWTSAMHPDTESTGEMTYIARLPALSRMTRQMMAKQSIFISTKTKQTT